MLDRIVDAIWSIVTWVPPWLTEYDSPNFKLIRAMFGLLLIVLFVYLIAMRPLRPLIRLCWDKASGIFARRQ
jgi:hypothetical protein